MFGSLASKCPLFTSEQKGDDPQTLNPAFGLRCFGKDKINRCKQREGTQPDIVVIALIATVLSVFGIGGRSSPVVAIA